MDGPNRLADLLINSVKTTDEFICRKRRIKTSNAYNKNKWFARVTLEVM